MNIFSVSYSSDKCLSRCEQQWFYKYQEGLRPKTKDIGLYKGDWLHKLLKVHHLGGDWKKAFIALKRKLWTPLFDEEKEFYGEDFLPQVRDLMEHYAEHWAEQNSKWKPILIEEKISIPTKFGFPVNFIVDMVAQTGKYKLLVETKTGKNIPDAKVRIFNVQPHSYCYLLQRKGIKIDQIVWDYIKTEMIAAPQVRQDGRLSERQIDTDRRTVLKVLKENKIPEADYKGLLDSLPKTKTLERHISTPNLKIGELFVRDWIERARRVQKISRPTRNFNKNCSFDCDFYKHPLCLLDMEGKQDRNLFIKQHFVKRGDE